MIFVNHCLKYLNGSINMLKRIFKLDTDCILLCVAQVNKLPNLQFYYYTSVVMLKQQHNYRKKCEQYAW